MFLVRCPHCTQRPVVSGPHLTRGLISPVLSTRQKAADFNQPLSFDTSQVTTMEEMFRVCCTRARPLNATSSPHAPSRRILCRPFDSWQRAEAFNQPLSFDTSRVTSMLGMFRVRFSRVPGPGPLVHRRSPAYTSVSTSFAPPPRQDATVFNYNQMLSFNTSRVSNMQDMFRVRSTRARPLNATSSQAISSHARSPRIFCVVLSNLGRRRRRSISR